MQGFEMADRPRLFCFGLGYAARRFAATLSAEDWRIAGTSREDLAEISALGHEAYPFNGEAPMAEPARALAGTTHLLVSVPPDAEGDPVLRHHRAEISSLPDLVWIGYLSTTGVYGDRGGGWVDETSHRRPSGTRGRRRVKAEDAWLALWRRRALPVHVFRLAGIYGPGRNALETVRAGQARRIVKPDQVFSRIHVDDIATILCASIARPNPGARYNLADDEAAPPQDVIAQAAALHGVEPPPEIPFDQADLSEMARSFYGENKRVSNRRIKDELGVKLRWPNYRAGLVGFL